MDSSRYLSYAVRTTDPPLSALARVRPGDTLVIVSGLEVQGCVHCEEEIDFDDRVFRLLNPMPVHSHGTGDFRASHRWELEVLRTRDTEVFLRARTDFADQQALIPLKMKEAAADEA